MASRYTTKNGRTSKRGVFLNGVWHCDCDPRQPADKFQTKNGGKNHGRWFYTCQKPQLKRCGFFLWSDEAKTREESAVLNNSRSEPPIPPQTPRKEVITAQPPTPDTKPRHSMAKAEDLASDRLERSDSFDWPSSADEDLAQAADSASKLPPQPLFETPRKAPRTDLFSSPGKRSYSNMVADPSRSATLSHGGDDVFKTPSTSNRTNGLLSPVDTPAQGRLQVNASHGRLEPSDLANNVLKVLDSIYLSAAVESQLIELLNKTDLRTQGIVKGREIARLAIQAKEKKIAELQARVAGLEAEKETSKAVIAHLKQDIATSPKKGWPGKPRRGTKSEV